MSENKKGKYFAHLQTPKGDLVVVSHDIASSLGFTDAMMRFQYGEGEESDGGFEEMMHLAKRDTHQERIRIQSIAWVICNNGIMPDERESLSKVERAHTKFEELIKQHSVFLGRYVHSLYSSSTYYEQDFHVLVENGLQYAIESAAHVITLAGAPEKVSEIFGRVKSQQYRQFRQPREYDLQNLSAHCRIRINSISELEELLRKK